MNINDELLILLKVKGIATTSQLAVALGLNDATVQPHLDELVSLGVAAHRCSSTEPPTYTCTAHGTVVISSVTQSIAVAQYDELYVIYRQFRDLNIRLKCLITGQQESLAVSGSMTWRSLRTLKQINVDIAEILDRFSKIGRRYVAYAGRLNTARMLIERGQFEYVASPFLASYHTIWFELHEDILITLRIDRNA
jgi:hypothetical protein